MGSGFWFKKFRIKSAQVSKTGILVFGQVLTSKQFHFAKSVFSGARFFWQSQVSKIGFKVFRKSFGKVGSGFFSKFIFSGKLNFLQSQFSAKVSASPRLLRFGNSAVLVLAKLGL